ncbi:uncharacterized protein LOC124363294 [Homalodisca vitripennis]|uniref:uncharacterized protein LOC124363294 n=1 Tax=Homalodisca vitripennis TaxID=197043 RepID=UPI001EE9C641|nr:uncharacterized protein LOC124363294 [Homalodisca vitripennis]
MVEFAVFVAFLAVIAPTVLPQEVSSTVKPEVEGAADFDYFRAESRWTANALQAMFDEVDTRLGDFIDELKVSNNASSALKKYSEAAEAVKDSPCVTTSEEFRTAQDTIESVIATCVDAVPQEDKNKFRSLINESINKTREIDNSFRQNSIVCTSLRLPPPPSCKATEKKLLADIDEIMSCNEVDTFNYHIAVTTENAKDSINACVENGAKDLIIKLETALKSLESCQSRS